MFDTARSNAITAQGNVVTAKENVTIAAKNVAAAKKNGIAIQCEDALAQFKDATIQYKAVNTQFRTADAEHGATITLCMNVTTLHNLATDCLQLSMYFFHPIQQCAQQVYHSTLHLSPTSSPICQHYLKSTIDDQLSHVTAFLGAPETWGLLLRTINIRPKQFTCIAAFAQRIVAACEDTVNIYDAVTGALQQSLNVSQRVTKIHESPDGLILFFAHSLSITMWDIQTGKLIHMFVVKTGINDIAVSTSGNHIAYGSSNGSAAFWDIHSKEGKSFGDGKPVVNIHWLLHPELAVATQSSVYIHNINTGETLDYFSLPISPVWGMVYSTSEQEFLVGTSWPGGEVGQELYAIQQIGYAKGKLYPGAGWRDPEPAHIRQPMHPTLVHDKVVCMTPSGVKLFDTEFYQWANDHPLLGTAKSVAMSLNRNLVVQTMDSIQIFSIDVLASGEVHNNIHLSHIHPLGEEHIICLQPNRHLTLLELETLQELHPKDDTTPLRSLLTNQSSVCTPPGNGLIAEFGASVVMQAWHSDTPLPERAEEDVQLSGLSPKCTWIVMVCSSPRRELRVKDAKEKIVLANLSLEDDDLATGEAHDLAFDSETRFYLTVDGPGGHVKIPYDIIASPSGSHSYTITRGEPEPLSEPRPTPPYTLDANYEWVLDARSRKICWISPENLRRGNGGHFWAGLSLVMLGDDGVVRKITFREPDC